MGSLFRAAVAARMRSGPTSLLHLPLNLQTQLSTFSPLRPLSLIVLSETRPLPGAAAALALLAPATLHPRHDTDSDCHDNRYPHVF